MIYKFDQFINETLQKSQSIIKSKMEAYEKLKDFLASKNSIGYLGKLTEFLFNGVPYNELMNLYNDIVDFKKKNVKFNLDSYEKYENALDDIAKKKIAYKFRYIYNQFPKEQKDLFDLDNISDSDVLTISKIYDVDDYTPFIKKISRYKSEDGLMDAASLFLKGKSKSYTREYVKSLINENIQLAFENDNILIVKVKNWESIKKLGDDTSWCIVASESTFKSYTKENRNQYVLFDYTKDQFEVDFKIGFTVSQNDTILYAHDILDSSCIPYLKQLLEENKVSIKDINVKVKFDISKFNKQSSLKEIEEALKFYSLDESDYKVLLSILLYKENRIRRSFSEPLNLTVKIFDKMKKSKGDPLTVEEVAVYRDCFVNQLQYDKILDSLKSKLIVISNEPPDNIFNSRAIDDVLKYYKNWNITINKDNIDTYFRELEHNDRYAEVVLYYAQKSRKYSEILLLIEYCKHLLGQEVDEENIKNLINLVTKKEKNKEIVYDYYNYFGIKYHYSDDVYHSHMDKENIIPEKVSIKGDWRLEDKLKILSNCEVTVNFDKAELLSRLNSNFKVIGQTISKRADSHNKIYHKIFEQIKDNLTGEGKIRKKIVFKSDVKFPLQFKCTFTGQYRTDLRRWGFSKEVDVIIS